MILEEIEQALIAIAGESVSVDAAYGDYSTFFISGHRHKITLRLHKEKDHYIISDKAETFRVASDVWGNEDLVELRQGKSIGDSNGELRGVICPTDRPEFVSDYIRGFLQVIILAYSLHDTWASKNPK